LGQVDAAIQPPKCQIVKLACQRRVPRPRAGSALAIPGRFLRHVSSPFGAYRACAWQLAVRCRLRGSLRSADFLDLADAQLSPNPDEAAGRTTTSLPRVAFRAALKIPPTGRPGVGLSRALPTRPPVDGNRGNGFPAHHYPRQL